MLSARHALLDPVRALLERAGIPVRYRVDSQQAYSLFRLREVQEFLSSVAAHAGPDIDAAGLRSLVRDLRAARPREQGVALVEDAVTAFLEEQGEHGRPKPLVREFFGELLMQQRRERTLGDGVLLGTVHGSKGAEHDHVLLLDGGWQPRGGDTWEELRRLYYVGMTRARQTLTLVQCARDGAPWVPALHGAAVHRTLVAMRPEDGPAPRLRYELLTQADIYLAFPARDAEHEEIASAIRDLATGDALRLVPSDRRLVLHDAAGLRVGALSEAASLRWREHLPQVCRVRVAAILIRRRTDEGPDYQEGLRRDTWQVVIPEVTYSVAATPA